MSNSHKAQISRNKALVIAVASVALLTGMFVLLRWDLFLIPLFPGALVNYAINWPHGHGGTSVQEMVGAVAFILTNIAVYFWLIDTIVNKKYRS